MLQLTSREFLSVAPAEEEEFPPMSKTLRAIAACAALAGLAACAAPPPPTAQVVAPAPKPLDAKTQLENH